MPINLEKLGQATKDAKPGLLEPKQFFDKKLTGRDGAVGLLNRDANPRNISRDQRTAAENRECVHMARKAGPTEFAFIPFYIVTPAAWDRVTNWKMPSISDMSQIARRRTTNGDFVVHAYMKPHTAIYSVSMNSTDPNGKKLKVFTPCYHLFLYVVPEKAHKGHVARQVGQVRDTAIATPQVDDPVFWQTLNCNPSSIFHQAIDSLEKMGYAVDRDAFEAYIDGYSLYKAIKECAYEWQQSADEVVNEYLDDALANDTMRETDLVEIIHRLEAYQIPLELYRRLFAHLYATLPADFVHALSKENLNLLLAEQIDTLDKKKPNLTSLPPEDPANPVHLTTFTTDDGTVLPYSAEQRRAIETRENLALIQAGAGSGKSSVILARIKFMNMIGISPKDITVISFTNAAADNIKEKNPDVQSMTVSAMIHRIYTTNFDKHHLSSIDTMRNSLDIYCPGDDFCREFDHLLDNLKNTRPGAWTAMNTFVEKNYDDVMRVLDTIGQTTLELEIIICYQRIEYLVEPHDVTSRHLIIDEVQDNSIFEFIYVLKYVAKHNESLFIVGDSSQTLYEFRSANPRALNVLEASGVFSCYKLEINYRSNQDILDFANCMLSDIEANRYANIQLKANNFSQSMTLDGFREHVRFSYERFPKVPGPRDTKLRKYLKAQMKPYMIECLDKGEEVAIITKNRRYMFMLQEIAIEIMGEESRSETLKNIASQQQRDQTIFTRFINDYWDTIRLMPASTLMDGIKNSIITHSRELVRNQDNNTRIKICSQVCARWETEKGPMIRSWVNQYLRNFITYDTLLELVRQSMIDYEIRNNAVARSLHANRKKDEMLSDEVKKAKVKVSTVHGVKGLEFENVIYLLKVDNNEMTDEETKRLTYVALTRAHKTELICSFGTMAHPMLQGSYDGIIQNLEERELQATLDDTSVVME